MRCLSLSADGIDPVSSRVSIFSAIVFPTPASSAARPCFASSSTDTPASRIALAALRYATTRYTTAPSSSYRLASSSNASAISPLRIHG